MELPAPTLLAAALYALAIHRLRFDRVSALILLGGLALYLFHLHSTTYLEFALDAPFHAYYVEYIGMHRAVPPDVYDAMRHPPLYYGLAAIVWNVGAVLHMEEPMALVRYGSLALYLVFMLMSTHMLRRLLSERDISYYTALALLVFWPIGVTMGGRITCDLLTYISQIGLVYALARFLERYEPRFIAWAFWAAALAVSAKNSGVLLLGISFCALLVAMWQHRASLKALLRADIAVSIAAALLCTYLTLQRAWIGTHLHGYSPPGLGFGYELLYRYLVFEPYLFISESIFHPDQTASRPMFMNWFMRTLLLGDFFTWNNIGIIWAFGLLWLCMLAYILLGLVRYVRAASAYEKRVLLMMAGIVGLILGSMMVIHCKTGKPNYADIRFIYIIVPVIALYYGKAMAWAEANGDALFLSVGRGLALGFVLLTCALYTSQHLWR